MPNSPDQIKPCIYYAIGDVHGEVDRLVQLHDVLFTHHKTFHDGADIILIHLGDYVDRGPDSCGAVEVIMSLEQDAMNRADLKIVNLRGNHEQIMLDALADPEGSTMRTWMRPAYGGQKTLDSYSRRKDEGELLRDKHCEWFKNLPAIWSPDDAPYIFVHAGVDPILYPLEDEEIYLWTRSQEFFDPERWRSRDLLGAVVVHGHTPTGGVPEVAGGGRRINVDTGAVYGGPLTCAVLDPQAEEVVFLEA